MLLSLRDKERLGVPDHWLYGQLVSAADPHVNAARLSVDAELWPTLPPQDIAFCFQCPAAEKWAGPVPV